MPVTHKVPSFGKPGSVRGIHLDFKYHMPNKRYMLNWLKRLPGYGINAILVEYEDKFPFKKYPFLRDKEYEVERINVPDRILYDEEG